MTYLGHVFPANGMRPDEKKIAAVKDWPTPKDATEVHQFLGLASYYRRYVLKFAEIACPLNNLMQKGMSFLWPSDCEQAFLYIKEKLIQAPVGSLFQTSCHVHDSVIDNYAINVLCI